MDPGFEGYESELKALALLPIPGAFLSICGSATIVFIACRTGHEKGWTTYNRLLFGMSVSDILFSGHLAVSNFLRPSETSYRPWAIGNDTTCSFSGFMLQLTSSAAIYNACLSYYFLLATRFRYSKSRMARGVEPWMHLISIGFPLITSTVGLILGAYSEPVLGLGCWVNEYPRGCGAEPGKSGEVECRTFLVGFIFGALPFLLSFFSVLVNNWAIYRFVKNIITVTRRASGARDIGPPTDIVVSDGDETRRNEPAAYRIDPTGQVKVVKDATSREREILNSLDISLRNSVSATTSRNVGSNAVVDEKSDEWMQLQRLQLVQSQAFLFVASFFLAYLWILLLMVAESVADTEEEEVNIIRSTYWLQVLQAIFYPSQGFLNMLVYVRPKYLQMRQHFPNETRFWAFKRCIQGKPHSAKSKRMGQTPHRAQVAAPEDDACRNKMHPDEISSSTMGSMAADNSIQNAGLPRKNVALKMSSITRSSEDFESRGCLPPPAGIYEKSATLPQNGRWSPTSDEISSKFPLRHAPRFKSSLAALEEDSIIESLGEVAGNHKENAEYFPTRRAYFSNNRNDVLSSVADTISSLEGLPEGEDRWNEGISPKIGPRDEAILSGSFPIASDIDDSKPEDTPMRLPTRKMSKINSSQNCASETSVIV